MARKLSQEHLDLYKAGGKLNKLFNVVINDPELSFEIREKDTVIIYYLKKKILTISKGNKIIPIDPAYYKGGNGPSINITDFKTIQSEKNIKWYLNEAKLIAYKHSRKSEFVVQQNISIGSKSFDSGLVVVDMEWGYSQSAVNSAERIERTRPDLLAIDPKPNEAGENDIYLVEVKHSLDAIGGDSGMQGHVKKTWAIISNENACTALVEDIRNIISQKQELGLFTGNIPKLNLSAKPKMMFFLSYRSAEELELLKKELKNLTIPIGMEYPAVQYYNYSIQLSITETLTPIS